MKRRGLIRDVSLIALIIIMLWSGGISLARSGDEPVRSFEDGTFSSSALPKIAIRIEKEFQYVGRTEFDLAGVAHVDRHHFVDAGSNGEVERLIILHFEGFFPENDQVYRYRIPKPENASGPDARFTLEPVRLGENDYIHNTWFFDARQNIDQNPGRELDRTARLLEEKGYALPGGLRMSRFVRIVDEAAKHEFILFYLEPLAPTGLRASDFVKGGAGEKVFDKLSAELTERSRSAFQMVEE